MSRPVVHIAGPEGKVQRCSRCGEVLADSRVRGVDVPADHFVPFLIWRRPYPEGAKVEIGTNSAGQVLVPRVADMCRPRTLADVTRIAHESARPCGCDAGAGWTCAAHQSEAVH